MLADSEAPQEIYDSYFFLSMAALFVMAGSLFVSTQASAQLGNFCGGTVTVSKALVTPMAGHRVSYTVLMTNPSKVPSGYVLAFEPIRNTQAKPHPIRRMLKPGETVKIDLGYSVDVEPLGQEDVVKGIRVSQCR